MSNFTGQTYLHSLYAQHFLFISHYCDGCFTMLGKTAHFFKFYVLNPSFAAITLFFAPKWAASYLHFLCLLFIFQNEVINFCYFTPDYSPFLLLLTILLFFCNILQVSDIYFGNKAWCKKYSISWFCASINKLRWCCFSSHLLASGKCCNFTYLIMIAFALFSIFTRAVLWSC